MQIDDSLIDKCIDIALQAGRLIMPYYHKQKQMNVIQKPDNTPCTEADVEASLYIVNALQELTPDLPVLSEEDTAPDFNERKLWTRYWLIDPLDGTRGFINGSADFTVNIALIDNHNPVLGVVVAPVSGLVCWAREGAGAWCKLSSDDEDGNNLNQKTSRELLEKLKLNNQEKTRIKTHATDWNNINILLGASSAGKKGAITNYCKKHNYTVELVNSSLKIAYLAMGRGDLYPRVGPTCEWDLAAGQCILQEAGGVLVDFNGLRMQYNRKSNLTNGPFVAIADSSQIKRVCDELKGALL